MLKRPHYVLVTPARNEAQFIELTIQSVLAQTERPLKWVIVSDGSTDGTEDIVRRYAVEHEWIALLRMPDREERHFAGKVYAFNAGLAIVKDLPYEVIVSLDADISFEKDYISFLLDKLSADPMLGLVGTPFLETSSETYDYRLVGIEHVSGACQVFRRECFEAIGGYVPVKGGLIDNIAVITARMKGWKTRAFTDKVCVHHRQMGTAQFGPIRAKFKIGFKDYAIGNHPVWELFRIAYQMTRKPIVLRGLALGAGYLWALMQHEDRPVSRELIAFHRREQMHRLTRVITGKGMSSESPVFPQGNAHKPSEDYERAIPVDSVNVLTTRQPNSCLTAPGAERDAEVLKHPLYVLVTSARDEAQFIESTIQSVLAQTERPLKWVIVSDGSTDGTDDIVKRYAVEHEWIELLRMPERKERNFAGKAYAVNAGQNRVADLPYQVIVCLDADVVFDSDYFSYLLEKLAADHTLGLVGTPFHETSQETYDYRFVSVEHVSGPCQVFRRECFEAIGGYVPVKTGSIDHIAVISAKMKGWKTRTFTEKYYLHSREMGTAQCGPIQARINFGIRDYVIGNHPLWELFRSVYQMTRKPYVLRGLALAAGYVWASVRHVERQVSREFLEFQRREQMDRLTRVFTREGILSESSAFPQGNARKPR